MTARKEEYANIRLKKATVQRLNAYKATRELGTSHDDAINEVLDKVRDGKQSKV